MCYSNTHRNKRHRDEIMTKTAQEYGSELNAISFAMRKARETGMPWYSVECAYGWIDAERKPSLRFGNVWECHPNGTKGAA